MCESMDPTAAASSSGEGTRAFSLWRRRLLAWALAAPALAQPTVAPTGIPAGPAEGQSTAGYNIRESFELGYRFHTLGGDEGMYRSAVNFRNGLRLLSSSLQVNSREGHGHYFDLLQLNTQGLGNDPYQNAALRIEKNRLYRYDLTWRSDAYYNPGQRVAGGQHFTDTVRRLQNHDVTFFPQSSLRFFLGYSNNVQTGPALTTIQLFDTRGDEYPLFADIRRRQNEYRAGAELSALGWRLNLLHGWVNFKDDTPVRLPASTAGNNPEDLSTLDSLRRAEPYHGNSPYWRVALFRESRRWAFNGRFTYVTGRRSFVQDETSLGTDRFGQAFGRQIVTLGVARRPAATGNAAVTLFPGDRVTIANQTSFYSIRMVGDSLYTSVNNGAPVAPFLGFSYLAIRTIANSTDMDVRWSRWFGLRLGYQYSTRRIGSKEARQGDLSAPIEQENALHTGLLGFRIRPARGFTIRLDGELGRADRPFFPVSQRNFHALRGRVEYTRDAVRLGAYARADYNINSVSLASFASRSRQYGLDATWTLRDGVFVDLSYARLHLDTLGTIFYFADGSGTVGDRSYYVSNLHSGNVAARFAIGARADVSLGVSHVQDTGDGRAGAFSGGLLYSARAPFRAAQTFPLRFTSPLGRLSIRVNDKLRWNAGYQHYGYSEEFSALQNFRAHTGYTSLSWAF
jgi:hypothetical protein